MCGPVDFERSTGYQEQRHSRISTITLKTMFVILHLGFVAQSRCFLIKYDRHVSLIIVALRRASRPIMVAGVKKSDKVREPRQ